MSKTKKPPVEDQPYPALRDWAARIGAWLDASETEEMLPSQHSGIVYLPHREADGELLSLSVPYPVIAEQITKRIELCNKHRERLRVNPDDTLAADDLCEAMTLLRFRLDEGIKIIDRDVAPNADHLAEMRRAIEATATEHGHAKPDQVLEVAVISRVEGKRLLRQLEKTGEYTGFTRGVPARYKSS